MPRNARRLPKPTRTPRRFAFAAVVFAGLCSIPTTRGDEGATRADPVSPASNTAEVSMLQWLQNPWTGSTRLVPVPDPDMSLWNAARIEDYRRAVATPGAPPLAMLGIERLGLQAPVYNGTSTIDLDRGLGRIPGMARIHDRAHLGISGHRDGHFRVLKDLAVGDRITVQTADDLLEFEVQDFTIVDKQDHGVLRSAPGEWRLTLVTCYPFYFVGNAPQRFIVHALPVGAGDAAKAETDHMPAPW